VYFCGTRSFQLAVIESKTGGDLVIHDLKYVNEDQNPVFNEVTDPERKKVMDKIEDKRSEASSTTACAWVNPDLNDISDPDDDFAGGTILSGCADGVLKACVERPTRCSGHTKSGKQCSDENGAQTLTGTVFSTSRTAEDLNQPLKL
jgi:hypothetical protein